MYSLEIIIHFYGLIGGFSEILKVLPSQCSFRQVFLGYMYALLNYHLILTSRDLSFGANRVLYLIGVVLNLILDAGNVFFGFKIFLLYL